jgi:hypothetical protein
MTDVMSAHELGPGRRNHCIIALRARHPVSPAKISDSDHHADPPSIMVGAREHDDCLAWGCGADHPRRWLRQSLRLMALSQMNRALRSCIRRLIMQEFKPLGSAVWIDRSVMLPPGLASRVVSSERARDPCRRPRIKLGRAPVQVPRQAFRSSLDCRDQLRPHSSYGCSLMRWHGRCIPAD